MPPPSAGVGAVSRQLPKPSAATTRSATRSGAPRPGRPRRELLQRQEVAVPPAVLEDRELHAGVGRSAMSSSPSAAVTCERLVHDHVEAVRRARCGEVDVRRRGRAEDHEVEVAGERRTASSGRRDDPGARVEPRRGRGARPGRRDDRRPARSRGRRRGSGAWKTLPEMPKPTTAVRIGCRCGIRLIRAPPRGSAAGVRSAGCRRGRRACRTRRPRPRP